MKIACYPLLDRLTLGSLGNKTLMKTNTSDVFVYFGRELATPSRLYLETQSDDRFNLTDLDAKYPARLKDYYVDEKLALIGIGHVYQNKIKPALVHLGVGSVYPRQVLDPNQSADTAESKIEALTEVLPEAIGIVISPNHVATQQMETLLEQHVPTYKDKPIAINEEGIKSLEHTLKETQTPIYFGDYYLFKALPLLLAMGVKLPFKDSVSIDFDPTGVLRKGLEEGVPVLQSVQSRDV